MRLWILCVVAALAISCEVQPLEQAETANPGVTVHKLFEYDGCTVFRFKDAGVNVYWANCPGSTRSSHTEDCGKNCTRTVTNSSFTTWPLKLAAVGRP